MKVYVKVKEGKKFAQTEIDENIIIYKLAKNNNKPQYAGIEVLDAVDIIIDGNSIHEINHHLKNAKEFSKVAWMTPYEKCQKYQIQCCSDCENIECCDNTNPLNPKYSNPALQKAIDEIISIINKQKEDKEIWGPSQDRSLGSICEDPTLEALRNLHFVIEKCFPAKFILGDAIPAKIKLKEDDCPYCKGTGNVTIQHINQCSTCLGTGKKSKKGEEEPITVSSFDTYEIVDGTQNILGLESYSIYIEPDKNKENITFHLINKNNAKDSQSIKLKRKKI